MTVGGWIEHVGMRMLCGGVLYLGVQVAVRAEARRNDDR